jgi:hypothetical protein
MGFGDPTSVVWDAASCAYYVLVSAANTPPGMNGYTGLQKRGQCLMRHVGAMAWPLNASDWRAWDGAGFNAVLTALLNIAFIAGSYYVIKNSKTPIAVGFLIGSAFMITLLNFMTAVYWGQLSKCQVVTSSVAQYSCSNPDAYGAVCAFAVLMFLVNLVFTGLLVMNRGELISESAMYDDLPQSERGASPYEAPSSSKRQAAPPSADL